MPVLATVLDRITWSYANLARPRAALTDGADRYLRVHHMIRAWLFKRLRNGEMALRSLFDDEREKSLAERRCVYCIGVARLSLDHLIPRCLGGADEGANLLLACRPCNSAKGGRDLLKWYALRGEFVPILLLRRYSKLAAGAAADATMLDRPLDDPDVRVLPVRIDLLPLEFPPLRELRL